VYFFSEDVASIFASKMLYKQYFYFFTKIISATFCLSVKLVLPFFLNCNLPTVSLDFSLQLCRDASKRSIPVAEAATQAFDCWSRGAPRLTSRAPFSRRDNAQREK